MARMMLLTKANRRALPALYSTENDPNPTVVVKFFNPTGRGTWYATEFDGEDLFFGYVESPLGPDCDEWGYFSLAELSAIRLRFGLGIERDRYFDPRPIGDIVEKAAAARRPAEASGEDIDKMATATSEVARVVMVPADERRAM